jgi:3-oxoacyl-[acyl-carrier-protein] synthase II
MEGVVVTGAAVVSAIASGVADFEVGLATGRKGIGEIQSFDAEFLPCRMGAEVKGADNAAGMDKKALFMHTAMSELLADSKILDRYAPTERVLNLGGGVNCLDLERYINDSDIEAWPDYVTNCYDLARQVASQYDIRGGVNVCVSACVASNQAIGLSVRILRQEPHRVIVTGGVDSMLDPLGYMGFYKLGALSSWEGVPAESCRPFDRDRCGVVLGEGAALFLLESRARALPGRALAEIVGYGASMDAYLVTDPRPDGLGLARAAQEAIADAGISPADIDCVHLHGTGTPKNGIAEANAMRQVFGERFTDVPVFGLKGQIGHLIGACGAVELLAAIYSLQRQQVLPTVNFEEPDPGVPLRVVRGEPLEMEVNYVLKLNAAFGGQNAALVPKRIDDDGAL